MSTEISVPPIELSVPLDVAFPSVTERYFTAYYYVPKTRKRYMNSTHTGVQNRLPVNNCLEVEQLFNADDTPAYAASQGECEPVHKSPDSILNSELIGAAENGHFDVSACTKQEKEKFLISGLDDKMAIAAEVETTTTNSTTCDQTTTAICGVTTTTTTTTTHEQGTIDKCDENPAMCVAQAAAVVDAMSATTTEATADNRMDTQDHKSPHVTGEETCILMHSNRLCVVTISPYHPIVLHGKLITNVDYQHGRVDRLQNAVRGKGKRGAQVVGSKSLLCSLTCDDGSCYPVLCGAQGKLIQINERLLSEPDLVRQHPQSDGFLALVLPRLAESNALQASLMPANEYVSVWRQHFLTSDTTSTVPASS